MVCTTGCHGNATISDLNNRVNATDTLKYDASGKFLGLTARTTQTSRLHDPSSG